MQIEPFQGEPQLLDARLKYILPPIVDAYLGYLKLNVDNRPSAHLDLQSAICIILYTLCKVRGYKVVVGSLNNEPRYLEPILNKLEEVLDEPYGHHSQWQVPYVLLLWLSHLLLTPFDLASISNTPVSQDGQLSLSLPKDLPSIAIRILRVGMRCLPMSTKAQDGAAMLLIRLVTRPDMQRMKLADSVVENALESLESRTLDTPTTIYERLGPLRFLASVSSSAELDHLIPSIYRACERLFDDDSSSISTNAVGKKLLVKTLRNVAILCLRVGDADGPLLSFLQTTSVLEDVIDYLLKSLGDRDTPVRFASAKALSRIILELDEAMAHEVIQAILDTFKEDMPRQSGTLDFRTVNALKWHGLTLALAHALFKRSAAPSQLPDIFNALVSALQFEQRTATGSSVGTNVRDAANFGIWSLSRRYTTEELLSVDTQDIRDSFMLDDRPSVIQIIAIHLILSSCLDPMGNIRRGSSAALQELVGRHPNQVHEGISLVQIVEYQAIGLRRRAMVDVASRAAELEDMYWQALVNSLLGWRGNGSSDVPSREAAAAGLARLSKCPSHSAQFVLGSVRDRFLRTVSSEVEDLHGLTLSIAKLIDEIIAVEQANNINGQHKRGQVVDLWDVVEILQKAMNNFSTRLIRSVLPAATVQLLSALCRAQLISSKISQQRDDIPFDMLDSLTDQLLARQEQSIQQQVPAFVQSLMALKRRIGIPLGCIGAQHMAKKVAVEGSKSTLNGACRAIALGTLAPLYQEGLSGQAPAAVIDTLAALQNAINVDWRVVGLKALQLAVEGANIDRSVDQSIVETITDAVHRGLNDYTIDERGDIGSLVRLRAISCTCTILAATAFSSAGDSLQVLYADIYRVSLEKLDRVRLEAARCRHQYLEDRVPSGDIAAVSSEKYFSRNLEPLSAHSQSWKHRALLEGCISCAGHSAEPLLQASRSALALPLHAIAIDHLNAVIATFSNILKSMLLDNTNMTPALELLAFLLDMQILQRLAGTDFKWRNLLSTVQKSHHKSNDIARILAALHVYGGLVDIPAIRDDVLKKLISMLKTNPYPRVRSSVAETLFIITQEPTMKNRDWLSPSSQNMDVIEMLQRRYVKS